MKIKLIPVSKLGKWSIILVILMPIFFSTGSLFADYLYINTSSEETILEDMLKKPVLSFTMLLGMLFGITAFITGVMAISTKKDKAILVLLSTFIGTFLILFLFGELFFPH